MPRDSQFEDGAEVFVEPVVNPATKQTPPRGSVAALLEFEGRWVGDPGELDRLIAEVQSMREEDLEMEIEREKRMNPL